MEKIMNEEITNRRLGKMKFSAITDLIKAIDTLYKACEYKDAMELTLLVQKWAERDDNQPILTIANNMLEVLLKKDMKRDY